MPRATISGAERATRNYKQRSATINRELEPVQSETNGSGSSRIQTEAGVELRNRKPRRTMTSVLP